MPSDCVVSPPSLLLSAERGSVVTDLALHPAESNLLVTAYAEGKVSVTLAPRNHAGRDSSAAGVGVQWKAHEDYGREVHNTSSGFFSPHVISLICCKRSKRSRNVSSA